MSLSACTLVPILGTVSQLPGTAALHHDPMGTMYPSDHVAHLCVSKAQAQPCMSPLIFNCQMVHSGHLCPTLLLLVKGCAACLPTRLLDTHFTASCGSSGSTCCS